MPDLSPARTIPLIERNQRTILAIFVAIVLFAGIVYSLVLGETLRYLPDEREYVTLAENVIEKRFYTLDGEQPTAYRPPGYPFLLAIFYSLGANIILFRVLNFVLLAGCIFFVYKTLQEHSSLFASVLGVVLVFLYPVFFYTAGTLYPQTLAAFMLILAIFLLTKRNTTPLDFALAGIVLGSLILTVPTFMFVLAVFAGWTYLSSNHRMKARIWITLALAVLVIGLWTARNYLVFDQFVFVSSNSGENLLVGNSENSTPNAGTNTDISAYRSQTTGMDEIARDQFYTEKAIEYIREHTSASINLYLLKVANYFNFRNDLVTRTEASTARDLLMLLTYGPLVVIFFFRLVLVKLYRPSSFEVLLILLYLLSAFFTAIFFTRIRFRVPFDLLLIMVDAVFLTQAVNVWLKRSGTSGLSLTSEV